MCNLFPLFHHFAEPFDFSRNRGEGKDIEIIGNRIGKLSRQFGILFIGFRFVRQLGFVEYILQNAIKYDESQEYQSKRHITFCDSDDDKWKHDSDSHEIIRKDIHECLKRIYQLIHLFQKRSRKVVGEKLV